MRKDGTTSYRTSYGDKLRDPRWQRKRLEVMNEANFVCADCGDNSSTLHVHHKFYVKGRDPWEYETRELICLCEPCHQEEHLARQELAQCAMHANVSTWQMLGYVHGCALISGAVGVLTFEYRPRFEYLVGLGDVYHIPAERLAHLFEYREQIKKNIEELSDEQMRNLNSFDDQAA